MTKRLALACCKLYISTASNLKALESIEQAAGRHPRAPLLHIFKDEHYNRVGYTLAGECVPANGLPLRDAVLDMIEAAIQHIDLSQQSGSHPRLGVVDHVCFHPLGSEANLQQAAGLARFCAETVGGKLGVPTYVYGAAHDENEPLDSVRRKLGYFRPTKLGLWQGAPTPSALLSPHFGPTRASPRTGLIIIGAAPWISNYNIPILSGDLESARRIARKVSERGGGLPHVQAMALLHGDECIEIACNLLDVRKTDPTAVQRCVESLARDEAALVVPGYLTHLPEKTLYEQALTKL